MRGEVTSTKKRSPNLALDLLVHNNRPFATNDHMVQNPPCWRASSLLFPHWDIINKGKSSLTGSGLFVLMSQWGNNNELALQHGGFLYHVIVSCKRPIETLKYLNSDWLRIVWFKCTIRSIRIWCCGTTCNNDFSCAKSNTV